MTLGAIILMGPWHNVRIEVTGVTFVEYGQIGMARGRMLHCQRTVTGGAVLGISIGNLGQHLRPGTFAVTGGTGILMGDADYIRITVTDSTFVEYGNWCMVRGWMFVSHDTVTRVTFNC